MKTREFVITITSLVVAIILIFWSILVGIIAIDLKNEINAKNSIIKELKWENENNYTYCLEEEYE